MKVRNTSHLTLSVYMEYKDKQNQFKEVHKTVERIRNSGFRPSEMKQEYQNLEQQKERLVDKIQRVKKKVERVPNLKDLLQYAETTRKEQDEEKVLAEKYTSHSVTNAHKSEGATTQVERC